MKVKKWIYVNVSLIWGFPGGSVVKNLPANEGERGPILRSGRSPGGRNGNPPPSIFVWETPWAEGPGGALWDCKELNKTELLNNNVTDLLFCTPKINTTL